MTFNCPDESIIVFVKCHLNTARIRLPHPAFVMLVIEEEERRQERRLLFGARPSPSALFIPLAQQCPHMRSAAVTLVHDSFLLASMNGLGLSFLVSICISFDYTAMLLPRA